LDLRPDSLAVRADPVVAWLPEGELAAAQVPIPEARWGLRSARGAPSPSLQVWSSVWLLKPPMWSRPARRQSTPRRAGTTRRGSMPLGESDRADRASADRTAGRM